jgi:transposase-like protein/IS1 family transposase
MDPRNQFCHNPACPARGQTGQGNITIHSRQEQRYKCARCGKTFAATTGTALYRLHKPTDLFVLVVTLLCHGCPPQAIVAAFGLDERTVAAWLAKAGAHSAGVHEHLVAAGQVPLGHVQADELWVKLVGRKVWMALALAVPTRLWLGGVISAHRDGQLVGALARLVRACAAVPAVLVCTDGFAGYVTAFRRAWRQPAHTGRAGRPRLLPEAGLLLGQVVKQYAKRRVVGVAQRVVLGTPRAVAAVLRATGTGRQINTSYIERLNATFRASLVPLVRRGRALARKEAALEAGMWLVGTAYNFCWPHEGLRLAAQPGAGRKWHERTPAMAAGLTDHPWSMAELLRYQVPPPARTEPKRRKRSANRVRQPAVRLAA